MIGLDFSNIPYQVFEMQSAAANKNKNYCYLSGPGGSGKTFAASKFVELFGVSSASYIFLGPTGKSVSVAAEKNLVGQTIHSFFKIQNNGDRNSIYQYIKFKFGSYDSYIYHMKLYFKDIKYIFIDEVSMLNNEIFSFLIETIRRCAVDYTVFFIGDFHQLPPVIKNSESKLKPCLDQLYELYFNNKMNVIEFITRYRSDHALYNEFLHLLRIGDKATRQDLVPIIEQIFNVYDTDLDDAIVKKLTFLEYTNESVKSINNSMLEENPNPMIYSEFKIIMCEFPKNNEPTKDLIIDDFQLDKELYFKVDSKIIFRVNDYNGMYKNGDEAIITGYDPINGVVTCTKLRTGTQINVTKHIYSSSTLQKKDGFIIEVEQWPFSLGVARTFHKAQGDGFDYMHINFDFMTNPALSDEYKWQLFYVAISRVINPNNVYISKISLGLLKSKSFCFRQKQGKYGVDYKKLTFDCSCEKKHRQEYF